MTTFVTPCHHERTLHRHESQNIRNFGSPFTVKTPSNASYLILSYLQTQTPIQKSSYLILSTNANANTKVILSYLIYKHKVQYKSHLILSYLISSTNANFNTKVKLSYLISSYLILTSTNKSSRKLFYLT